MSFPFPVPLPGVGQIFAPVPLAAAPAGAVAPFALPVPVPTVIVPPLPFGLVLMLVRAEAFPCPCISIPGAESEELAFAGGRITFPSVMRTSEIDTTAVGVGCADDTELVVGTACGSSGPFTTTGDVVLGRMGIFC